MIEKLLCSAFNVFCFFLFVFSMPVLMVFAVMEKILNVQNPNKFVDKTFDDEGLHD